MGPPSVVIAWWLYGGVVWPVLSLYPAGAGGFLLVVFADDQRVPAVACMLLNPRIGIISSGESPVIVPVTCSVVLVGFQKSPAFGLVWIRIQDHKYGHVFLSSRIRANGLHPAASRMGWSW
ncbi:hypothetical protein FBPa47_0059 [Pseudomonas phage vB_PeaS_FBPa47]|nr:hypothetical protein FBPa47_0059 [Pseudomonas phage vB_PeaS_FBPa47]